MGWDEFACPFYMPRFVSVSKTPSRPDSGSLQLASVFLDFAVLQLFALESFAHGTEEASDDACPPCKQTFGGEAVHAVNSIHDLPRSDPDENRNGSGKAKGEYVCHPPSLS